MEGVKELYQVEFPDFVLDVEIPEGWDDASWHNDICPSWEFEDKYKLFIDYKNPEDREWVKLKRFCLTKIDDPEFEALFDTENYEEMLAFIKTLS